MEISSVVLGYLASKIMDDIRCGRELDEDFATAVYKYPFIDRIRVLVGQSDREVLLKLASLRKDNVAIWSFVVGGLLRSLGGEPEVRKLFEDSWRSYHAFDRRYPVLFRLLDYTDLDPTLRDEIWQFVKSNLQEFVFERSDWYGGVAEVLESVRRRLDDPSFPDQKKWIYLVSVLASSDHDGVRGLLQNYANGSDAFASMVARHVLQEAESLWDSA